MEMNVVQQLGAVVRHRIRLLRDGGGDHAFVDPIHG